MAPSHTHFRAQRSGILEKEKKPEDRTSKASSSSDVPDDHSEIGGTETSMIDQFLAGVESDEDGIPPHQHGSSASDADHDDIETNRVKRRRLSLSQTDQDKMSQDIPKADRALDVVDPLLTTDAPVAMDVVDPESEPVTTTTLTASEEHPTTVEEQDQRMMAALPQTQDVSWLPQLDVLTAPFVRRAEKLLREMDKEDVEFIMDAFTKLEDKKEQFGWFPEVLQRHATAIAKTEDVEPHKTGCARTEGFYYIHESQKTDAAQFEQVRAPVQVDRSNSKQPLKLGATTKQVSRRQRVEQRRYVAFPLITT